MINDSAKQKSVQLNLDTFSPVAFPSGSDGANVLDVTSAKKMTILLKKLLIIEYILEECSEKYYQKERSKQDPIFVHLNNVS